MKLFYLFIKRNPWNFEWELMREWVGWVETPPTWWGERWGHHKFVAAFPSYKKRGESTLSSHTCCHLSLPPPAAPPLGHPLGEAMTTLFLHHTTPSCCWSSGGSSTSAAPLDRGNGGRHQAVRVTDHGSVAGLQRTSSRSWDRCEFDYITNEIRSWNSCVFEGIDRKSVV